MKTQIPIVMLQQAEACVRLADVISMIKEGVAPHVHDLEQRLQLVAALEHLWSVYYSVNTQVNQPFETEAYTEDEMTGVREVLNSTPGGDA